MKAFTFRAQAALDMRRKQEDEAKRALALADAAEREAQALLDATIGQLDDMLQKAEGTEASADLAGRIWRQHWIVGQRQRIERCRQTVLERQATVQEATRGAQLARRQALSLERFRDRAWRNHTRDEAREAQKALDDLGAVRFALGRPTQEETREYRSDEGPGRDQRHDSGR